MKYIFKIILLVPVLIVLCTSFVSANEPEEYAYIAISKFRDNYIVQKSDRSQTIFKDANVTFWLYKSNDSNISINNIAEHDSEFIPFSKEEILTDTNITYWLKIDLGSAFPAGRFVYAYGDAGFTANTFTPSQSLERFTLGGMRHMRFTYTPSVDKSTYYFMLKPIKFRVPLKFVTVGTNTSFYADMEKSIKIKFVLGIIMGLIGMAAIYNLAMYYYNRQEKSFLYYTLLQACMIALLYLISGVFDWDSASYFSRNSFVTVSISLIATIFATLFIMAFLETKRYVPKIHQVLRVILAVTSIDMLISIFYKSILFEYYIFPFFMLPFLYAGYRRVKQSYKPALFYLAGWAVLAVAVFLNMFPLLYGVFIVNPLYIGSTIEAILFSLAISYKMRIVSEEKEQQKEILIQQSKLSSMGEMLGNIAHQWRQPLTHLGYTLMNIKEAKKHDELDNTYLDNKIAEANTQLEFMSQTIDDFKDFYAPDKDKENFSLEEASKEVLEIIGNSFRSKQIEIKLKTEKDLMVHNYKNEFKQVLLNILLNAKDILTEREIENPQILITVDGNTVSMQDNGGGMSEEVMKQIFEPYFSTKSGGLGIGLYMSKVIVEHNMGGELGVSNIEKGAMFTIKL